MGQKNAWPRPRNGVSQICEKFLDTYPSAPRWQRTANGSAALAQTVGRECLWGGDRYAGSVKSVVVGLRPCQNIKQKQQPEHPEEYEANVC